MIQVDIQFARERRSPSWVWLAAIALSVAALGASLWDYAASRAVLDGIEAELAQEEFLSRRRNELSTAMAPPKPAPERIRAINAAIGQLNLPWRELFGAFEAAKPQNVALIALVPDGRKRTLVLQAESKTPEHMLDFLDSLSDIAMFEEVTLRRHEVREDDPNRPYRFTAELVWRNGT